MGMRLLQESLLMSNTDDRDTYRQEVALFRYGLIADLIQLPAGSAGLKQRLHEKAARDYTIPGSSRTRAFTFERK